MARGWNGDRRVVGTATRAESWQEGEGVHDSWYVSWLIERLVDVALTSQVALLVVDPVVVVNPDSPSPSGPGGKSGKLGKPGNDIPGGIVNARHEPAATYNSQNTSWDCCMKAAMHERAVHGGMRMGGRMGGNCIM